MLLHTLANLIAPATLILDPIEYDSDRLWMLLPITLAIAVVYKTTRIRHVRHIPVAAFLTWIAIVAGMIAVAAAAYVITYFFA